MKDHKLKPIYDGKYWTVGLSQDKSVTTDTCKGKEGRGVT